MVLLPLIDRYAGVDVRDDDVHHGCDHDAHVYLRENGVHENDLQFDYRRSRIRYTYYSTSICLIINSSPVSTLS